MKLNCKYSFALEMFDGAGRALGSVPVEPDFEPAIESARFGAIRAGAFPAEGGAFLARIVPRWNAQGPPYLAGFRVEIAAEGVAPVGRDFPNAYFEALATRASAAFVADDRLASGERFRYLPSAFGRDSAAAPVDDGCSPTPLRLLDGSLEERLRSSEPHGTIDEGDPIVIVPREVLDQVSEQARDAGARETGGILVGDLCRDDDGDVYAVVQAQIPATTARGELTSLTFGPETWAEVDAIVAMRGRDETMLGWEHSHPAYEWNCKRCPLERRRRCPLAADFFSEQDRALHARVFPRAYSIALVVTLLSADEHSYSMFGWRDGLLVPRGFHVQPNAPVTPRPRERTAATEETPENA